MQEAVLENLPKNLYEEKNKHECAISSDNFVLKTFFVKEKNQQKSKLI